MEEPSGCVSKRGHRFEGEGSIFFLFLEGKRMCCSFPSKFPPKLCNVSETQSTSDGGNACEALSYESPSGHVKAQ